MYHSFTPNFSTNFPYLRGFTLFIYKLYIDNTIKLKVMCILIIVVSYIIYFNGLVAI